MFEQRFRWQRIHFGLKFRKYSNAFSTRLQKRINLVLFYWYLTRPYIDYGCLHGPDTFWPRGQEIFTHTLRLFDCTFLNKVLHNSADFLIHKKHLIITYWLNVVVKRPCIRKVKKIQLFWKVLYSFKQWGKVVKLRTNNSTGSSCAIEADNFSESLVLNQFGNWSISNQHAERGFFFCGASREILKSSPSSASEKAFPGFLANFWLLPPKRGVFVHKNLLLRCPQTTKLYHYPSWVMISRIWKISVRLQVVWA